MLLEHLAPGLDGLHKRVPLGIEEFIISVCDRYGFTRPWNTTEPVSQYDAELTSLGATLAGANIGIDVQHGVRPVDSWKHRSAGVRCSTCMWYVRKDQREKAIGTAFEVGRCRRHAPTLGGYPVVKRDDWCGDHKLDENKA